MWLDLVTYLHHHGQPNLPWYRGTVSPASVAIVIFNDKIIYVEIMIE